MSAPIKCEAPGISYRVPQDDDKPVHVLRLTWEPHEGLVIWVDDLDEVQAIGMPPGET